MLRVWLIHQSDWEIILVVGVLGGELVELTDDGDLLLDGCLNLCYQRRICIL